MNPLTTVKWPLIIGFVVAVIIASLIGGFAFNETQPRALAAHRVGNFLDRPLVLFQRGADPGYGGRRGG